MTVGIFKVDLLPASKHREEEEEAGNYRLSKIKMYLSKISQLTTPQMYLVILWRGLTPWFGTT